MNNNLRKLRGEKTIEEVTDALMINPNVYEAYESGKREPLPSVKKKIADYFGLKEKDIWKE